MTYNFQRSVYQITMGLAAAVATVVLLSAVHTSFWALGSSISNFWSKLPVSGSIGAVTSGAAVCSKIGLDAIKEGGNAADAAIATQFCLGVVRPDLTGIGGGGFALVRARNGSFIFLDFRETAPAAASRSMYINGTLPGGLAVGVPGEVRGLQYLHHHFGSLPWGRLVSPAADLAIRGFRLGEDLNDQIVYLDSPEFLSTSPSWRLDFAPQGIVLTTNDTLKRERYGRLLQSLARNGGESFYTGQLADYMVQCVQAAGGILSKKDLESYKPVLRKPVEIQYRGYRIMSGNAPSGGPVALSALNILEGYSDLGTISHVNVTTHRLDEALRFAFGLRTRLADPSYVKGMDAYVKDMVSKQLGAKLRSKISEEHTLPIEAYNPQGFESLPTPGTSNLETADQNGMVISLTSTIDSAFGSRIMVPETGLVLNDEMRDFSVPNLSKEFGSIPAPDNFIEPGKRPQSSITTVIVENSRTKKFYMATGGAGGTHIVTAVTQALWHVLDQQMTSLEAIKAPRLHDQLNPNQVGMELDYDNGTVAYMASKGHNVSRIEWRQSDVHAIRLLSDNVFEAAAETSLVNSGGYVI